MESIYADDVLHPRFGRGPRLTGLDPTEDLEAGRNFGWLSTADERIPGTAIEADLSRQSPATVAVTHYFDRRRRCIDCKKHFIFYAAEQKYWYETLQFYIGADCIRCVSCRAATRLKDNTKLRYERLLQQQVKSPEDYLLLAKLGMDLFDLGLFGQRSVQKIQWYLNRICEQSTIRAGEEFADVNRRSRRLLHADG